MAIDLTTFSARTRPVVRQPVYQQVNRMEADYEAAGKSLLAEAGANVLKIISQEAALSARNKVKQGTDAYLFDFQSKLANSTGSDEASKIMNDALMGFDEYKSGLVRESEGGLIKSALAGFGKAMTRTSLGETKRVTDDILSAGSAKIEENALGEISVLKANARTPQDTAAVIARITASRNALNEKFPAVWAEAVQDHKVMSFESAMLEVYNEKGIEASVAFGRDLNTAQMFGLSNTETTQIVNVFENQITQVRAQAKVELEAAQEVSREEYWDQYIKTDSQIDAWLDTQPFTAKEKEEKSQAARARADKILSREDMVTTPETRFKIDGIIDAAATGIFTKDQAFQVYLREKDNVAPKDEAGFIKSISDAANKYKDDVQSKALIYGTRLVKERQDLLRSSIGETIVTFFSGTESQMKKDLAGELANEMAVRAQNDLSDAFKDRSLAEQGPVDEMTNKLIIQNSLSPESLERAVAEIGKRKGLSEKERAQNAADLVATYLAKGQSGKADQVTKSARQYGLPIDDIIKNNPKYKGIEWWIEPKKNDVKDLKKLSGYDAESLK